MMEESSDESTEIISNEEAEMAKQLQEATELNKSATEMSGSIQTSISPPAPLPSFMSKPESDTGNQASVPVVAQKSSTPPSANKEEPEKVSSNVSKDVTAPGPVQSPYEASAQIEVPAEMTPTVPQSPIEQGGLFGWFSGNKLVSKVVEKTKSSMESMITTLDPGMKEVIRSGGDVNIAVTSTKESKVGAESQATTAAQPVGFTAGLKGAEERIQNLRQKGSITEQQPIVSIEGFIVELLPDRWYELSCLLLKDPQHRIELQTFSQPSPIPAEYILKAQDSTPSDYPLRWSGLAVTIGQVIEESQPHIGHADWQNALLGVSRRDTLQLAAQTLAFMYKERLPTSFVS
ncbi:hypothetical protein KUTeg_018542 [Tegillarca granosa]|uniref:Uncharacterized protein n=1 Tax=Tegillarca granosa TaxID=220873 RepID=A0ABQ9EI63_TEGGR|nr:hypothetical protein KUTeg_018542 [Tegillarca granosa]